jgi:outer membrane protein OmpA-like peptidoglycan-associated protein
MIALLFGVELNAQRNHYMVSRTSFSSGMDDEFSPVFYNGGMVFCSNMRDNSLIGYRNEHYRLFKIFYVDRRGNSGWKYPRLFARELSTDFNDGPVTFNAAGNTMYYSRNNAIGQFLKNVSDTSNKLGIYEAELINGKWDNIRPFKFNNPHYSLTMPSLTPDGNRLFFSSDNSDGHGGMDLYYCDRLSDGWSKPVNLGPVVNTPGNETFPFAGVYGKLYFASDGHKGFGGKDIFYTQEINGEWIAPVHLDSSINSTADDFGLVTDSTFESGFFSSNRLKTDDIFSFRATPVVFPPCDSMHENNFCFTFYDEHYQNIDTISVTYIWDFGNGIIRKGPEVKHCFPGPGSYSVKLSILDDLSGDALTEDVEYNVDLEEIGQAGIYSYDIGLAGEPVTFEGLKTNLPDFRITDYLWDFGEGFKPGGAVMTNTFNKKGEYMVQFGLLGEKDSLDVVRKICVMKKIRIFDGYEELDLKSAGINDVSLETDTKYKECLSMQAKAYLMDDLSEKQKARIKALFMQTGGLTIKFNYKGILPDSYPLLENIAAFIKVNPDIRLQIVVHTNDDEFQGGKMKISDRYAQELAFFFRNENIIRNTLSIKGIGMMSSVFGTTIPGSETSQGVIECIFFKNNTY